MEVDRERWFRLCAAARDADDDGPQPMDHSEAQKRATQARVDLERHTARGPQGHVDRHRFHSKDDIEAAFDRDTAELQRRIDAAERELKRIQDRSRECAARRNQLNRLVEDCRRWAAEQRPPITLPGDEARVSGALRNVEAGQEQRVGRTLSLQPGGR